MAEIYSLLTEEPAETLHNVPVYIHVNHGLQGMVALYMHALYNKQTNKRGREINTL